MLTVHAAAIVAGLAAAITAGDVRIAVLGKLVAMTALCSLTCVLLLVPALDGLEVDIRTLRAELGSFRGP